MLRRFAVKSLTRELFDADQVFRQFKQAKETRPQVQKLYKYAEDLGFKPGVGPGSVLGFRESYKALKPIKDPRSKKIATELQFSIFVQDLVKPGSRDKWAIAQVSLAAGEESETYEMLLEAPLGNIQKSREWMVGKVKVERARSWWSRMKKCLTKNCLSTCVAALVSCSGSWVAYLACVAGICGGCWVKCAACAACRCRWWCKWATGCC